MSTCSSIPSDRSSSLLNAFAGAVEQGVSVAYYTSADGTGTPVEFGTMSDVSVPSDINAHSARFAGYLEAPTAGAYRFFAIISAEEAQVELRFDHLPDPIIRSDAG